VGRGGKSEHTKKGLFYAIEVPILKKTFERKKWEGAKIGGGDSGRTLFRRAKVSKPLSLISSSEMAIFNRILAERN